MAQCLVLRASPRCLVAFGLVALVACARGPQSAPLAPVAPARADVVSRDTPVTLSSGTSLTVPSGWRFTERDGVVELEDREGIVRVGLVAIDDVDPVAAIGSAWQRLGRGPAPHEHDEPVMPPPDHGWDSVFEMEYRSAGKRQSSVLARRFGGRTWVALLDVDPGALDRRAADLDTVLGSVRPRGMKDESLADLPAARLEGARARALSAFAEKAFAALEVPGAAISVMQGGKVVFERAYGVRTLGALAPISRDTLFLVGSVTKPMTSLMQAALVDAGTVQWDTPVTSLLPGFAVADRAITEKLVLWHMACACTGMPRHDLENLFEYADVTPEIALDMLRTTKPTSAIGEVFQYSNAMYAAGGFAAARAYSPRGTLAAAYESAMRATVFGPIGMGATTLDFASVAKAEHASPHARALDGTTRAMPLAIERNVLPIAPAGAVFSTLADMERFTLTELAGGVTPEGRRIVSVTNGLARRTVRVRNGDGSGYALGLDVGTMRGLGTLGHDGGAFGYGTTWLVLPRVGLGIVVLTNVRNGGGYSQLPFNDLVVDAVLEAVFGGAKPVAEAKLRHFEHMRRRDSAHAGEGVAIPPDPAWTTRLDGTYRHARLGTIVVDRGVLDAGEWRTALGRRTDAAGRPMLVFADPPFAGTAIAIEGESRPSLVVTYAGERYVFERVARSERSVSDPRQSSCGAVPVRRAPAGLVGGSRIPTGRRTLTVGANALRPQEYGCFSQGMRLDIRLDVASTAHVA